ncbi:MAG: biotin carboxylase, partial [Spirosomaceae bacterium]|nr:biotin carboxylase [Spirosomataceae bacterium]
MPTKKATPKPKAITTSKAIAAKPTAVKARKPAAVKVAKTPTAKPEVKVLRNISDIRSFFYRNEMPIYFISATNFNLLGADEWIKGFKFICHIECFDGLHPNVFSPEVETEHEEFQSIEDINNYLLENKEVVDFIQSRKVNDKAGKALFLMFDEKTEQLAKTLGLDVCFPSAALRTSMDNKVNTNRIAEKAGVACVPYVLSKVESYEHLREVSKSLGDKLVIQLP